MFSAVPRVVLVCSTDTLATLRLRSEGKRIGTLTSQGEVSSRGEEKDDHKEPCDFL